MTGFETLLMYARLRGVPSSKQRIVAEVRIEMRIDPYITLCIQAVIDAVGIRPYMHRQADTYSGGNKRRLSLGVALVGLPKLLMLDEPTTGVDPAARRAIWKILSQMKQFGTAIVLTSHR